MPDTDLNEFTEREKYILSYYRLLQHSSSRRLFGYNAMFMLASVGCIVLAYARADEAFGFVGYLLLLGRVYYLATEGRRWSRDFQSIFAKYDAKLKALTEAQKQKETGGVAA